MPVSALLVTLLLAVGFALTPQLILSAPIAEGGGVVQKIFYYHVPSAWVALLAVLVAGGGAVAALRGSRLGEELADAAAELAVLFGLLVLLTGPLWARVAWGAWWVWDARLTTTLVLWLLFLGYHLVKRYGERKARALAHALAIFGALDVPLVFLAVTLWRTQHPSTAYVASLPREARLAFFTSLALFTLLFLVLLWLRLGLGLARARLEELADRMDLHPEENRP